MSLLPLHEQKLRDCGLLPDTWLRANLHSGSEAEVRAVLGYGVGTGLVIPYTENYARVRIDNPGPDGKRYRSPRGGQNKLYVPKTLDPAILQDPSRTLYLTEGEFKALKATQEGFPCVALSGVWSWKTRLHGKSLAIPDLDSVVWAKRRVVVVFDSDLDEKPPVAWAEHALVEELRRRQAEVFLLRLPSGPRGEKYGLDDFLVAQGVQALRGLQMLSVAEADQAQPVFLRVSDLADAYILRCSGSTHRVNFGYSELSPVLRGIAPGEVAQILGRSGVGKSAFALNLIERMTEGGEVPTLLFSLEMAGVEMFERMASLTTGLYGREIEDRTRSEDPEMIARFQDVVRRWNHVVVVESGCTIARIDGLLSEARASSLWLSPLRMVVLDYLGLIIPRKPGGPYEHTSEAALEIKRLAKKHQVSFVSLCQIGRDGESGGEPVTLRGARDSGVVEEAADYVIGIWRPELSEKLTKQGKTEKAGEFKVRVLKNRSGPAPKTVTLHFEPASLSITSPLLPQREEEEPAWIHE